MIVDVIYDYLLKYTNLRKFSFYFPPFDFVLPSNKNVLMVIWNKVIMVVTRHCDLKYLL